jgi:hypothetical protein
LAGAKRGLAAFFMRGSLRGTRGGRRLQNFSSGLSRPNSANLGSNSDALVLPLPVQQQRCLKVFAFNVFRIKRFRLSLQLLFDQLTHQETFDGGL